MKKILLAALLTFTFPLTCIPQETCKRHAEPNGGFSFCPPEGWSIKEDPDHKFKNMVGPPSNGFTPNLIVTELENVPMSLKDFVSFISRHYSENPKEMGASYIKLLDQSAFTTFSKQVGIKLPFQSEKDGLQVRTTQYFFVGKGDNKIIMSFTALEKQVEGLDPAFDRSMRTFQMDTLSK